jgi:hypothetical protein
VGLDSEAVRFEEGGGDGSARDVGAGVAAARPSARARAAARGVVVDT